MVKKKVQKRGRAIIWVIWIGVLAPFVLFAALIAKAYFGPLPGFDELENPKSLLATELLFNDGSLMGTYFRENRSNVKYEEISPIMVAALVATEDERFHEHSGIDAESTTRALVYAGKKGGASTITQQLAKMLFTDVRSKNIWERVSQKFREWVIAVRLEKHYTKQEIVTMYLNKMDWIHQGVGIKSAAGVYFSTSPDSLRAEEAAVLVAMCKNPSLYNPISRPENALKRREVVLKQMQKNGILTQLEYDSLRQLPLGIHRQHISHIEGPAPYLREVLRADLTGLLNEKDSNGEYKYTDSEGEPYNIYSDGLKVYTTIDPRMQEYAEYAVRQHLSTDLQLDFWQDLARKERAPFDFRVTPAEVENIMNAAMRRTSRYRVLKGAECGNCGRRGENWISEEREGGQVVYRCHADDCGQVRRAIPKDSIDIVFNTPVPMRVFSWGGEIDTVLSPMDSIRYYKSFLQAGMMSMDPRTGHVKAWVGGIDYKHFKYDHVRQGRRQVGSTFKPFIYATALREGLEMCRELPNQITCFDMPDGQPDYCPENSDADYGGMVTVRYALANSMNTITAWIMKQFGAEPVTVLARAMGIEGKLDPVPSLCLGVADLSVYEMTAANCTFVNKGVYISPTVIKRVEDSNGNLIYEARPTTREALDEHTAYATLSMMKGVIDGAYNAETGKVVGTGMRIRTRGGYRGERYANIPYPMAGKTGTTQHHSDGWFMGLTPDLVTGVWVGAEDRSVRFSSLQLGQGANMALPIYGYYMNKVYKDESIALSTEDFEAPANALGIPTNCRELPEDKGPSWE